MPPVSPRLKSRLRILAIQLFKVFACLPVPALAFAQTPAERAAAPAFALAAWPTEKDLPGDVFAIAQDLEGYLWLGTPSGLVRFDGSLFQPWAAPPGDALPSGPVHALAGSSQGELWVGFGGGGGVARIHRGQVTRFGADEGAPPGVNALLEDRQGTIWAATGHGLFRYAGGRWSKLSAADGYDGEQAFSVYEDRAGRVWVGTARGLYRYEDRAFRLVDSRHTHVESLTEDSAGHLWVTDRMTVIRRLDAAGAPRAGAGIRLPLPGWRVLRDASGGLLVASFSGGLFRIADPAAPAPRLQREAYEHRLRGSPRALFRDRDDNVWVGMRGGLLRLSASTFTPAGPLEGLNHDGVRTAAVASDGSVWIATTHGLNRFAPDGSRRSFPAVQIRALHGDRSGGMWVASDELVGRYASGRLTREPIPGVETSRVNALAATADGLWLCTAFRGVLSWTEGAVSSHRQPGETARQCLSILADTHGRVWAGFTSGGAALHERGAVRALTERDGLAPGAVLQIVEARDGALWFATSRGLSRYQHGRITSITSANAPLRAVVPVLVEDEQGHIWVGVQSGAAVMRIDPREMNKVADVPDHRVEYTLFDESDGLQPESLMWQSGVGGVRDASGRLWLVNGQGMMVIDPASVRDLRRPALPRLEAVTVNGDPVTPSAGLELPNRAALAIEYAVLDLSAASKLRFRHLLDGVDAGWVYDGKSRTAAYANLPAGDYRFRVSTTHNGQWTEAASWSFSVAPPLYLSRWFLAAAAALLAAAIGAAIWLRVRAVEARYALVVAERARMSREIHDTLLQSLAALGPELEALAVRADAANGAVARELRRIRREVSRSVREARDSILELRRHTMGAPRLAESLAELAEATARRHGLRPNVSVTGRRPDRAAPEVDAQLVQVAREAVSNAVRHGQPTHVDIAVAYDDGHVTLTVRDDGCGFRPEDEATRPGENGHFGIVTMRERVEKIGGELRIESAPGQGAMVQAAARVTSEWV